MRRIAVAVDSAPRRLRVERVSVARAPGGGCGRPRAVERVADARVPPRGIAEARAPPPPAPLVRRIEGLAEVRSRLPRPGPDCPGRSAILS